MKADVPMKYMYKFIYACEIQNTQSTNESNKTRLYLQQCLLMKLSDST